MTILKSMEMVGIASLLTAGLSWSAAAQSAHTALKDKSGKDVGVVELTQTPGGVLIKVSLKGMPAGEHAFHIHNVGKCEAPSFESAGAHFNPDNKHHGILSGEGHAGYMPNLHIPSNGMLEVEVVNTAVTLDKGKPNSVFHPGGTSAVIHAGKDDYKSDPAGNAGDRVACGVISEAAPDDGRGRAGALVLQEQTGRATEEGAARSYISGGRSPISRGRCLKQRSSRSFRNHPH